MKIADAKKQRSEEQGALSLSLAVLQERVPSLVLLEQVLLFLVQILQLLAL